MKNVLTAAVLAIACGLQAEPVALFDGKTFANWEGNIGSVWRIESGEIVAGTLNQKQGKNDFLCSTKDYGDFELRLKYRRLDNNGGVQFRGERILNHHEMRGYQADFAPGIDGFLYDESRRGRFLAVFDSETGPGLAITEKTGDAITRAMEWAAKTAERLSLAEWNSYRIRAEGNRIQLWINGVQTVDYTEIDASISRAGKIAIQIHSGATEIRYKDISIEELSAGSVGQR